MDKKIKVLLGVIPLLLLALAGNLYKNRESFWNAVPEEGLITGEYHSESLTKTNGSQAILEVITEGDRIIKVEYNEISGPEASSRYYQGLSKRLSEYNFHMEREEGVSWAEVILDIEKQILASQDLSGDLDIIAGCTHSVDQSLRPLLESMEGEIRKPSSSRYYELTKDLGGGLYGNLRIILDKGLIVSCRYDELFAPDKKSIIYSDLKKYYRQSKYHSMEYKDLTGIGFNLQMDRLEKRVLNTQNLLDIEGLPGTVESLDGSHKRNPAWDNYLSLARIIKQHL